MARLRGGLLQFAHLARGLQVGQGFQFLRYFDSFNEVGTEGVGGEVELAHRRRCAVGAGEAAFAGQGVAVREALVFERVGEVQRDDSGVFKCNQFVLTGDSVLVGIAPESELGKGRVRRIEDAVAVAVQCGQSE
jgi:hypothetical protein